MDAKPHWDTDLYRAILVKAEEMKSLTGEKVLIVLTDGKNDIRRNPLYRGANALPKLGETDVYNYVSSLDSTFQIYPIGVGNEPNEQFLKQLAQSSYNKHDYYQSKVPPAEIERASIAY